MKLYMTEMHDESKNGPFYWSSNQNNTFCFDGMYLIICVIGRLLLLRDSRK